MNRFTLNRKDAFLLIIDIQEKLAGVMEERERVIRNSKILIQAAKEMDMPIIVTEQYPKGIGPTVAELEEDLSGVARYEKVNFSACIDGVNEAIEALDRKQIILVGMETHVCVFQTARELLEKGYQVFVPMDGVASRTSDNKHNGLDLIKEMGGLVTNTETIVFDLLKKAGSPEFKVLSKLIK